MLQPGFHGIPARCTNPLCRHPFQNNGIVLGPGVGGISIGNGSTTCPRCGSLARYGDGTYSVIGDALRLLNGPAQSYELLARVQELLVHAQQAEESPEQVLNSIATEVPEFASFLTAIKVWLRGVDTKYWLTLLVTIMGILISHRDAIHAIEASAQQTDTRIERIEAALERVVAQQQEEASQVRASGTQPKISSPRRNRNKPCPCGSNKKQRDCCAPYPYKQRQ